MSLKQRFASGVKWAAFSQLGYQALQFLSNIILARLLTPSEFGLMGMAVVVVGLAALFKDLGTAAAIIQRQDVSEELLSSIYWANVAFGVFLAVSLAALAPFVGAFFQETRVVPLLQVLSASFGLSGLTAVHHALLSKEMAFNKLAIAELGGVVVGSAVGVSSALLGAGVWSLVYQTLTLTAVSSIILLLLSKWRPSFIFSWKALTSVAGYSLNLTGFNLFNYFIRNTDKLIIGRFLGAQDLGYYTLAYRLMAYPMQLVSGVVGRVLFPMYAQIRDDNARFRAVYLKIVKIIASIGFPVMLSLAVVSEPLVLTVFGPQWQPVVPLLTILAVLGMAQLICGTVGNIYQAKGRTDWLFRWGVVAGVLVTASFAIGLPWGIQGVALAYAFTSGVLLSYPNFAIPFRLIDLKVASLLDVLSRPLGSSLAMALTMFTVWHLLPQDLPNAILLGLLAGIGSVAYLAASWLLNREPIVEVLSLVK